MVHSGAIAGAGISQGKSTTMGFDTRFFKYQVGNLADVGGSYRLPLQRTAAWACVRSRLPLTVFSGYDVGGGVLCRVPSTAPGLSKR